MRAAGLQCPKPEIAFASPDPQTRAFPGTLYIPQRGVQWKQGVVVYMTLYTSLLYNTTPSPLHPPLTAPPSAEYPYAVFPEDSVTQNTGTS